MDADQIATAETCLKAAQDGSLGFPQIVGKLIAQGFEGYTVDYRRNDQTFYLPDGDSVTLRMAGTSGITAKAFDAAEVERLVRWAQTSATLANPTLADPTDYSYAAFGAKAKAAGCAGYIVSFLGRRVVYFGRTAETHVEDFPN